MQNEKPIFTQRHILVLAFIYAIGFLLRWLQLDVRPVHHDESLHLMYGRYYYDWPDIQFYKYDAMLHGPLIYTALRVVYTVLGPSTWAGRAFTAFLGTIVSFTPIFFRRFFQPTTIIVLAAALNWSPSLLFWSRFIREDIIQLTALLIVALGALLAAPSWKGLVTGIGVALVFSGKENSYVTLALLIGLAVYEILFWFLQKRSFEPMALSFFRYIKNHPISFGLGVAVCAFVYCYLYSAGFRYDRGVLDGLYRKSLLYWWDQHHKERIAGPFLFHFYVLSWYEVAFLGAVVTQLVLFYRSAARSIQLIGGIALMAAIGLTAIYWGSAVDVHPIWKIPKLKGAVEILGLFILLIHPVICTTAHLIKREYALARWGYLFWASFFSYSYLGEKVPWLTVYVLVPGMIYLALYFESRGLFSSTKTIAWSTILRVAGSAIALLGMAFLIEARYFVQPVQLESFGSFNIATIYIGLLLIAIGFLGDGKNALGSVQTRWVIATIAAVITLHHALLTNYARAGKASEYMSQVHTTSEFQALIQEVRKSAEVPVGGYRPLILADGESTWPVTWYLADVPQYKFSATSEERKKFDFIFEDYRAGATVPEGFCAERINLRGWWVPDFKQTTLKGFTRYMLNHFPWGDTGYSYVTFLRRTAEWSRCPRTIN